MSMPTESSRNDQANADILLWQGVYRVALGVVAGVVAVGLRAVDRLPLSPVADATIGRGAADWTLGLGAVAYVLAVLALRRYVQDTREAGRTLSTLMVAADLVLVFWLVFLLAPPTQYHLALLVSLFSLQLTHVYFGRSSAQLMLVAVAAGYLLLNDLAIRAGAPLGWAAVLFTLGVFLVGALLVIAVQGSVHQRLSTLVAIFSRAEDGDFGTEYDVAADTRPDALTMVGRAYNRMRSQLATIVLTDPLSGCYNRRGFELQYRRELSRAARSQTELALLAIDLDHFKQVNDTHGHLVGDQVIAQAGELLRASARGGDVVARTGGEEFTILAPATNIAGAQHLALRIVESFRRKTFAEPTARVAVTVSVGVAADAVPSVEVAEALRARADEALYAAKRSGRNRVVLWSHGLDALKLGQPPAR